MNVDDLTWKVTTSYPFANQIRLVFILNKEKDFYIFGGYTGSSDTDKIAKFTTETENWFLIGNLNKARRGHGLIRMNNSVKMF